MIEMESALKSPTSTDMYGISTLSVLSTIRIIKQIQKRMKDPDVRDLEYVRVYDKLSREFDDFFNKRTAIFIKVIRGESLDILAAALYYQDQVARGLITEEEVANLVFKLHITDPKLQAESAANLAALKNQ